LINAIIRWRSLPVHHCGWYDTYCIDRLYIYSRGHGSSDYAFLNAGREYDKLQIWSLTIPQLEDLVVNDEVLVHRQDAATLRDVPLPSLIPSDHPYYQWYCYPPVSADWIREDGVIVCHNQHIVATGMV
jgi:hypothetical protein